MPVVPVKDPASAVLTDPAVSENKRFCSNCGAEVGRAKDGKPGETEGECATCGTYFNFRPRLFRGDLVAGQYEVLGCLAYGGLGWIYLAKDHNVSDRWVVLKGMIDTGDATSMASAVAERRFLAEVEHPNVVRIYNFVQHPDPKTGNLVGYIVMEYVGGQSLRQLALEHHRETGKAEPLPIGQVIAYGLEILPAIGYLHSIDMLYCDLKPDNVIQAGEQLKLIDLGAVRQTRRLGVAAVLHPRLLGAGARDRGRVRRQRHLHGRPHARRAVDRVRRLHDPPQVHAARPRRGAAVRAVRLVPPGAQARHAQRPACSGSPPPRRWPTS